MTDEQIKAAKSLKNALTKCYDAGLGVYAWSDSGIYAVPADISFKCPNTEDNEIFWAWHEENGMLVSCPGLVFDGGAGV